jgi:predicted metal-dependent phosphoesterase TrpH
MMSFKIDLHTHTRHSGDNDAEPSMMAEAAIAKGLHGIAFTEHSSYLASGYADNLRERFGDRLLILRGVEFSALEGHCLVFGVDTDQLSLKGADVASLIKKVNEHGGVAIPAHPYRGGSGIGRLIMSLKGLCAIEGYNGANMHPMNMMAFEGARKLGIPITGGSDAHAPAEVGSCYTEFNCRITQENFLDQLRKGQYTAHDTRKISKTAWPIKMPGEIS